MYAKVAVSPEGLFRYPTGRAGLRRLNHDKDIVPGLDFLDMIQTAGFVETELVCESGYNSSPVRKGLLFRAVEPT